MKHKMKKYAIGGPTKYMDDDSDEGMSMSKRRMSSDSDLSQEDIDKMSYSQAFKHFRNKGVGTKFTWRGSKQAAYKEGEGPSSKSAKSSAPKVEVEKTETKEYRFPKGKEPKYEPTSSSARGYRGSKPGSARVGSGRYDDPTSSYGERVLSPFKRLVGGNLFGQREVERVARGAGVGTEEARRRLREAGMKRGGMVKSSASRRADGIAKKGKTRGKFV